MDTKIQEICREDDDYLEDQKQEQCVRCGKIRITHNQIITKIDSIYHVS